MGQQCCSENSAKEGHLNGGRHLIASIPDSPPTAKTKRPLQVYFDQGSPLNCESDVLDTLKANSASQVTDKSCGPRMVAHNLVSIKPACDIGIEVRDSINSIQLKESKFKKAFKLIDTENRGKITKHQLIAFLGDRDSSRNEIQGWSPSDIDRLMLQFSSDGGETWTQSDFDLFMQTKFL